MENFSKKPKRGRPSVFADREKQIVRANHLAEEYDSARTKTNRIYEIRTITALLGHPKPKKIAWLFDAKAIDAGKKKIPRVLFTELGRLGDNDTIRAFAETICALKLPSVEAVRRIREWRLSERKQSKDAPTA